MEKLSYRKGRCQAKDETWARTVLLENVPWYVFEENIRAFFSDYKIKLNSVKFWQLRRRKKIKCLAEVEVFSPGDAEAVIRLLHGKREFGVKLSAYRKYPMF